MAVKRALLSDDDGLDNGPHDDYMSSCESTVMDESVGRESASQTSRRAGVLSTRASSLLRRTSRIMRKKGNGKSNRFLTPLVKQLSSLRNLVPYSDPDNNSCVIFDALRYLDALSKQVDALQTEFNHVIPPASENLCKVEVTAGERGIQIHVSCQKRPGIVADVLSELERLGMAFEKVSVASHDAFVFDAVIAQVEGLPVHTDVIRNQLWRKILEQ